jgi:hypothetical protein
MNANCGLPSDWQFEIIERAALMGSMPAAIADFVDRQRLQDLRPDGILGDLLEAERNTRHPQVRLTLKAMGMLGRRSLLWGVLPIVAVGKGWRSALPDEQGEWAFIAPAFDRHGLADLVAEGMRSRKLRRRLGAALLVGAEQIDLARETGDPLFVFPSLVSWLQGHCLGCVVIDWRAVGSELEGVRSIICSAADARRLYHATARCWPRPIIGSPAAAEVRRAA